MMLSKRKILRKILSGLLKCNNPLICSSKNFRNTQYSNFLIFDKEFILETDIDANSKRLAALLNQLKDNLLALISCASRVLSKYEKNYGMTELELLCVIWAIEHFSPYLYGRTFQIITDHKAITTVMKMKKPTSKITRMLLQLQEYDYYFTFSLLSSSSCSSSSSL